MIQEAYQTTDRIDKKRNFSQHVRNVQILYTTSTE